MALRIKDNFDLKELEKFDYQDLGVCYKKYGEFGVQYFINKATREIKRLHPYSTREIPTSDEVYDLIKADIVECVEV